MGGLNWSRARALTVLRAARAEQRRNERAVQRLSADVEKSQGQTDRRAVAAAVKRCAPPGPKVRRPWTELQERAHELRCQAGLFEGADRAALIREAISLEREAFQMAMAARTVLPAAPDKK